VQPRLLAAELRQQTRLALPIALTYLGQHVMGAVDIALLGRYSEAALAGSGIGNGLLFAITVFGMGAVMGLDTVIPQAVGAGEPARARRLLWHGLRVAVLVGLPLVAAIAAMPLVLRPAGVSAEVAREATAYIWWRLPGIVPVLMFSAMRCYLQAVSITRPLLIAMIVGNVVNAGLDLLLIFGDPGLVSVGLPEIGLPPLGSAGAAIATSVVFLTELSVAALAVRRTPVEAPPAGVEPPAAPDEARRAVRTILRLGVPTGLQLSAEVGAFALTALLAARLGTVPGAAHQVALALASFTFSGALGIGAATAVRVGHAVGRGDAAATRLAGSAGLVASTAYMSGCALAFVALSTQLARLITDDVDVIAAAAPLVQIAAVFQISDGAQAVGAGALRGLGDTRAAFVGNLLGHYAVGVPVSVGLAFAAGWGAPGLWWGLSAGLTAVGIGLWARFFRRVRRGVARA
jgi:MATE family multidrug resistance protein